MASLKTQHGDEPNKTVYDKWQEAQVIPVVRGYSVADLRKLSLAPWESKGGLGTFINLEGAQRLYDAYICEIRPGRSLKPQRHLFEELVYVLEGSGATTIWNQGGDEQTFEWQEGSLFSPPLNVWHQHFNGQGNRPAKYLAVTSAPLMINLFHNLDFIFKNSFVFSDRYNAEEGYFSGNGIANAKNRIWESNFIPDVRKLDVAYSLTERGLGTNVRLELSDNSMAGHISQFPVGTYKKAHRHKGGAHVIILSGTGYTLMWKEGIPRMKIDWHEGSMFVPPEQWFHQHFNTGVEPARYMALHWDSRKNIVFQKSSYKSVKLGGDQIQYDEENPEIRALYESELAKKGIPLNMPPAVRSDG